MLESPRSLASMLALVSLLLAPAWAQEEDPPRLQDEALAEEVDALPPEQDQAALDPAFARFASYLDRKPYQETVFEKLVEAAIASNALAVLIEHYQGLVESEKGGSAAKVVLARLYAREGERAKAIALLAGMESDDPELHALLGALYLDEGRPVEAAEALERALAHAEASAPEVLERIHAQRGEAYLAAGERENAIGALRDLAAVDPGSFRLRMEAAGVLARSSLLEPALEEYRIAAELAGEDVAKRSRAQAEIGRVLERLDRTTEALALYDEMLAVLGHGHWLERDVSERVLALHERGGTLKQLADLLRERAAASRQDLSAREMLARVLEELRDLAGAREVLAAACADFPDDLALGRRLIDVCERANDSNAAILEYQRLIERHPEELELYLELGTVLASDGRLEEARLHWERSLQERLDDGNLATQLAGLYTLYDMHAEAARMLERAIEIDPQDMRLHGELADAYERAGRSSDLAGLLERAERAAGEDPALLESYAAIARGAGAAESARGALERAVALDPGDARLVYALVELEVAVGETAAARDRLLALFDRSDDTTVRRDALARLLRMHAGGRERVELEETVRARAAADPTSAVATVVVARLDVDLGRKSNACDSLEAWIAAHPADELALEMLAGLRVERGQVAEGIAIYEELSKLQPRSRAHRLGEIAQAHLDAGNEDEAFACYEEIQRLSPDNAATFASVALTWKKLGEVERAIQSIEQALRLKPGEGTWQLELAALYEDLERDEEALELAGAAASSPEEAVRARARDWLYERLVRDDRVDAEIARLRESLERNPYDDAQALVLVDLFTREFEYELALELLDELATWRAGEPALLGARSRLLVEMERWEPALADLEVLWRLPDADQGALASDIAECALALGDRPLAERYLAQAGDPVHSAGFYERHGLVREAVEVLERALAGSPDDLRLLEQLGAQYERRGERARAIALQERLIALDGPTLERALRKAELEFRGGEHDAARATLGQAILSLTLPLEPEFGEKRVRRRLFSRARTAYSAELERVWDVLSSHDLEGSFREVAARALAVRPADPDLLGFVVDRSRWGWRSASGEELLQLVRDVKSATLDQAVLPSGYDAEDWTRRLAFLERSVIQNDPELTAREAQRVVESAADEPLTEARIRELTRAYREQEMHAELLDLYSRAHELFPDEEEYLAGLARLELDAERWEEAEAHLRELVGQLAEGRSRRELEESDIKLASYRKRLAKRLTPDLEARVDDASLRTLYRLDHFGTLDFHWVVGSKPGLDEAQLALAHALGKLGRSEEARALLQLFEPPHEEYVERAAALAAHYHACLLEEDAARRRASVHAVIERVDADPLLRYRRTWSTEVRSCMQVRVADLEAEERWVEAYELVRRWQGLAEAQRQARRTKSIEGVGAALEERFAQQGAALGDDPGSEALRAWRASGAMLVELAAEAGDWERALALVHELQARAQGEHTSDDVEIARIHLVERAGRWSEALDLWQARIDRKKAELTDEQQEEDAPVEFFGQEEHPDPHELELHVDPVQGELGDIVE